jgi:hypothetical protein
MAEPFTPSPPPAPAYTAVDIKLDTYWSRFFKLTRPLAEWERHFRTLPLSAPYRREDHPAITSTWPDMLAQKRRFIVARLPEQYARDGNSVTWEYAKFWPFPRRSEVRAAGGFEAYCHGETFREFLRPKVEAWQRASLEWYRTEAHQSPHHKPDFIADPDIEVHLLDPDDGEPVLVKVRGFLLPPPPAPVPVQPPPAKPPGIGRALRPLKKKVRSH